MFREANKVEGIADLSVYFLQWENSLELNSRKRPIRYKITHIVGTSARYVDGQDTPQSRLFKSSFTNKACRSIIANC